MHRILFTIGNFPVYSYGVLLGLAFLFGILFAIRRAPRFGVSPEAVIEAASLCIIGAVLASRLAYVVLHWEYYRQFPSHIFSFREGGLTFYGGVLGAIVLTVPYLRLKRYPLAAFFDLFAPPLALGYAIARVGCFLNGCCFGRVCPFSFFPLGVRFPHLEGFRYPTQIYAIGYSLVILVLLLRLEKGCRFQGELFLDYLALYGVARFLIEYLRDEPFAVFGVFTLGQVACLGIILFAMVLRGVLRKRVAA